MKNSNQSRMEKDLKKSLITSVLFSLMLVIGIIAIPLGATSLDQSKGYIALLAIGVVCAVLGFYGTPLIWVSYGNKRTTKRAVDSICFENISTINDLALHLGINTKQARILILNAIKKYYLVGYTLRNDVIYKVSDTPIMPLLHSTHCPWCGALVNVDSVQSECPYCGGIVKYDPTNNILQ